MVISVKNNKMTKEEMHKEIVSDFDHFVLYEGWTRIPPFLRMIIAGIIYYILFF